MKTITFFGSSRDEVATKYEDLIYKTFEALFLVNSELRVISGGYSGIMQSISKISKEVASKKEKFVEVLGVVFAGYDEIPNSFLDKIIVADNLGERVQTLFELGDLIIAFPGSEGTYHEIQQSIEEIKFNALCNKKGWDSLIIHDYWKSKLIFHDETLFSRIIFFNEENLDHVFAKIFQNEYRTNVWEFGKSDAMSVEILAEEIEEEISGKKGIFSDSFRSNVLAIDFAFNSFSENHKFGKNLSFASDRYHRALNSFFEKNQSLSFVNEDCKLLEIIDCKSFNDFQEETIKIDQEYDLPYNEDKAYKDKFEAFNVWNTSLKQFEIGKMSFWLNKFMALPDLDFSLNISVFLILNTIIPKSKSIAIISLIENFIWSNSTKLSLGNILNNFNTLAINSKKDAEFVKDVLSHKHTIFNLDPTSYLTSAEECLLNSDTEGALVNLRKSMQVYRLLNIANRAGLGNDREHPLANKPILEILKFLELNHYNDYVIPFDEKKEARGIQFDIEDNDELNFMPKPEHVPDIFTVFFNLWSNCTKTKSYPGCRNADRFWVKVYKEEDVLLVSYKNQGVLPDAYIPYMHGKSNIYPEPKKKFGGMKIVKEKIHLLGWAFREIKVDEKTTEFIIAIKPV